MIDSKAMAKMEKYALTAVMRKMATCIFAIAKNQCPVRIKFSIKTNFFLLSFLRFYQSLFSYRCHFFKLFL